MAPRSYATPRKLYKYKFLDLAEIRKLTPVNEYHGDSMTWREGHKEWR